MLFIITHLELGGAQKHLLSVIKGLNRNKYEIYLLTGGRGYLKGDFFQLDFLRIALIPELTREIRPISDFISFFKMFFYIKKNKFDIVHTHSPKASILGRWAAYLAGVKKIVYTVHGWPFHKFMNPLGYYFYLFLERITASVTEKIIVVSKDDLYKGVESKVASVGKLSLIHYGIDVIKFDQVYRGRKDIVFPFTIITVSALKPQKGIFYFLRAAKSLLEKYPDLNFIIVGDGQLRRKVETEIESMGFKSKIVLKGWRKDVDELFKQASLFLLTSLWEGLPIAVIEAVAAGIPVVVTDTAGVRDIVENNKQGIITPLISVPDIEKSCIDILINYERWSKIVKQYRTGMDLFYWSTERVVGQIEKVYQEL